MVPVSRDIISAPFCNTTMWTFYDAFFAWSTLSACGFNRLHTLNSLVTGRSFVLIFVRSAVYGHPVFVLGTKRLVSVPAGNNGVSIMKCATNIHTIPLPALVTAGHIRSEHLWTMFLWFAQPFVRPFHPVCVPRSIHVHDCCQNGWQTQGSKFEPRKSTRKKKKPYWMVIIFTAHTVHLPGENKKAPKCMPHVCLNEAKPTESVELFLPLSVCAFCPNTQQWRYFPRLLPPTPERHKSYRTPTPGCVGNSAFSEGHTALPASNTYTPTTRDKQC